MPKDVKVPFIRECELYGAEVNLVDGLITDAGRIAAERGKPLGWYDTSTLKEPYRIEGKKTMAYELGEQLDWQFPDWIIYPTGGGTGMVGNGEGLRGDGAHRLEECRRAVEDGLSAGRELRPHRSRLRAGRRTTKTWQNARTVADGLRCTEGDRRLFRTLVLYARAAAPRSRSATPTWFATCARLAPGKASAPHQRAVPRSWALRVLLKDGRVKPSDTVVVFNTGGALEVSRCAGALISQRNTHCARRADDVEVQGDVACLADNVLERHGHDIGRMEGHHCPELPRHE